MTTKQNPEVPMAPVAQSKDLKQPAAASSFGGNPVGEEIAAAIRKYYQGFASDKYEDAVALMLPGMTVYPPYGALLQLPSQQAAMELYKQIHSLGFHQADVPIN